MSVQPNSSNRHPGAGRVDAVQELAEKWLRARSNTPGFREGTANTPRGEIPEIEVVSWLQLPYVLARLSKCQVKLVFPKVLSSAEASEQAAIKAFLQANCRAPMEAVLASLPAQISMSPSFVRLTASHPGLIGGADAWIAAHGLSAPKSCRLITTDLVEAPAAAKRSQLDDFKRVARDALAEHVSSGRPLVVTVRAGTDPALIAKALDEALKSSESLSSARESAKVWMPSTAARGSRLEELSVGSFLTSHSAQGSLPQAGSAPQKGSEPGEEGMAPERGTSEFLLLTMEGEAHLSLPDSAFPLGGAPALEQDPNLRKAGSGSILDKTRLQGTLLEVVSRKGSRKVRLTTGDPHQVALSLAEICDENPDVASATHRVIIEHRDTTTRPPRLIETLPLKAFLKMYLPPTGGASAGAATDSDSSPAAPEPLPGRVAGEPRQSSGELQDIEAFLNLAPSAGTDIPGESGRGTGAGDAASAAPASENDQETKPSGTGDAPEGPSNDVQLPLDEQIQGHLAGVKAFLQGQFKAGIKSREFVAGTERCFQQARQPDPFHKGRVGRSAQLHAAGRSEKLVIKEGRACEILRECMDRSLGESAQRLFQSLAKIVQMREPAEPDLFGTTSRQTADLVTLPGHGTAVFMSDLEGGAEPVASLIDHYKLIERWERKEPVFLCILGDSIDRRDTGSLLMEFLLELKVHRGFAENVIILPGNHEISVDQNYQEIESRVDAPFLGDLFRRDYPAAANPASEDSVRAMLEGLCPEVALSLQDRLVNVDLSRYRERFGLYTLFYSIFQALPRSIVSENGAYAAHAGFPMHAAFGPVFDQASVTGSGRGYWLEKLADVRLPQAETAAEYEATHRAINDMLWNDLTTEFGAEGEFAAADDSRRHTVFSRPKFTLDDFARFKKATGTSLMIRGHQHNPNRRENLPGAVREFFASLGEDSPACAEAWVAGDIATVEHHDWCAMLDLSIQQPSIGDIAWIGERNVLQPNGTLDLHLHWPPLLDEPASGYRDQATGAARKDTRDSGAVHSSAQGASVPRPADGGKPQLGGKSALDALCPPKLGGVLKDLEMRDDFDFINFLLDEGDDD